MNQDADRDLSRLYRAAAAEEPPSELDRRIAQAARREVRGSALRTFLEALPRWRLAVGVLAVGTLSVSLVTLMQDESPSVAIPGSSTESPAGGRLREDALRTETARSERERNAPSGVDEQRQPTRFRDAPQAAWQKREDLSAGSSAADRTPAEAASSLPKHVAPETSVTSEGSVSAPMAAPTARTVDALPPAAPAPPAMSSADKSTERPQAGSPTKLGRALRKEQQAASAPSAAGSEANPDVWARRLVDLLHQGREAEVRDGLARLHERYPDFVLPVELRRFMADVPARAPEITGDTPRTEAAQPPMSGR